MICAFDKSIHFLLRNSGNKSNAALLSTPVTCCQGGQAVSVGGGNSIILPNNVIVSTAGAGVTGVNQGTVTVNPVTIGGAVTQAQGTSQKPVKEFFLCFVDC